MSLTWDIDIFCARVQTVLFTYEIRILIYNLMNKRGLIVFALLAAVSLAVSGQTPLPVPYYCGFEDAAENANWVSVSTTQNDWKVGSEEKFDGDSSIYVFHRSGSQEVIGANNEANYMSLYRVVTLERGTEYEISFNWKNPGYGNAEMYVCWVPDTVNIPLYSSGTYDMPSWVKDRVMVQSDTILTGAPIWQNVTFDVMGMGKPYKLLFFFRSMSESKHPSGRTYPAACIDDVQIAKRLNCLRPRNLTYEHIDASRGLFSWEGDLGPFDLKYKALDDENWQLAQEIGDFNASTMKYEFPIRPLRKGGYVAAIRQICDGDTSIWAMFPNLFVYFSDNNCMDFTDLYGANVECSYGTFDNPTANKGVVDNGFPSGTSRHTIHYLDDEYDPRTNYKLKTTPPDGMPSVRLGNWGTGSQAEAIKYTYHVPEDAPLLLLKYAIVLEDPGHDKANQPSFQMIISDPTGESDVDELVCGQENFVADKTDPAWNFGGSGNTDAQIIYKEWTSAGLNLQSYAGKDVTIMFITKDCSQTGHFGYAYFTMDCMGAKITGVGCGDSMFGTIEAPEGFRYKWYPKDIQAGGEDAVQDWFNQPGYADTLQSFTPPGGTSDDGIFVCRIISVEAPDCWFELEANLDPRDVYPEVGAELVMADCDAKVTFTNTSYTKTRNRGDIGECELFEWDFGNGLKSNDKSPVVSFEPGTYNVTMRASIAEGLCDGVWDTTIVIPQYGQTVDTIHAHTCTASPDYEFEGVIYNTTGIRTKELTSIYGCDSIRVLDLVVSEEIEIEYGDTCTTEDNYTFYGRVLTETGTYTQTLPGVDGDCDTLVTLHLLVRPVLHIAIDEENLPPLCYGDSAVSWNYIIESGTLESYDVLFDDKSLGAGFADQTEVPHTYGTINIPVPTTAKPDNYSVWLMFDGDTTGMDSINLKFDIYYPSSIVRQKWNNVLAVTNADYNGGYEFVSFNWFVDGELISGATGSYLYIPDGTLKMGAEYQAMLTRADDGITTMTCPFIPTDRDSLTVGPYPTVYPTKGPRSSMVKVQMVKEGIVSVYDMLGRRYGEYRLPEGESEMMLPDKAGLYILKIDAGDDRPTVVRVMVTE